MSFFGKPSGEEPRITFERIDLSAPPLAEPPLRDHGAGAMAPAAMLVAAGSEIEGQLRSRGTVRVEGVLRGTIEAPLLLLEPGGVVEGTVTAGRVRLSGQLRGTVMAEEVEVVRTAVLDAELVYDEISIERGARVRGLHRQRDPEPCAEEHGLPATDRHTPPVPGIPSGEAEDAAAPTLLAAAATAAIVAEAEAALRDLAEASHAAAAAASDLAEDGVLELAGLEAELRATPERMLDGTAAA